MRSGYTTATLCGLVVSTVVLSFSGALAQEETRLQPGVTEPSIAVEELNLLLRPLTKHHLVEAATAWRDMLGAKAQEVSNAEIRARREEDGEAKAKLVEVATQLRGERTAVAERMTAVIEALRTKGGEVDELETYVSAVSKLTVDATDPSGAWLTIVGWLKNPEGGIKWGTNLILFLVTLIVFKILAGMGGRMTRKALSISKMNVSDLLSAFFVNTVRNIIFLVGIVVALSMLGVNIGPFLAAFGVVGFVIGFALQGTLSNFAAGIMILFYRPYDIGNVVTVAGVTGKVSAMSLVSTTLTTPDNQTVVVPNGSIWGGIITNITGNETRRCDLTFGIGYEDDIDKTQKILEEIITSHPKVLGDPAPVIKLHELADSSVNFVCRPWTKTADYWDVYWDLTRAVKKRFDSDGISIPFPQRDVHVYQQAS